MTFATPDGTREYAQDHDAVDGYFRTSHDRTVSSLGMGSYLGEVSEEANQAYEDAAVACLENGVNLLDTAINYREQQSERDLGRALDRFGRRDQVVVVTKGGFLHGDPETRTGPEPYVTARYLREEKIEPGDIVASQHCMAPGYLEGELAQSLENLGLDAVDLYLVHNPETQLENGIDPDAFRDRLLAAFELLEQEVDDGRIGGYGVATWEGLRLPQNSPAHLPLEQILEIAGEAREAVEGSADDHHLEAIQLPLNLALTEAVNKPTQSWDGRDVPAVQAAEAAGLTVLTSASLMQGRILGHIKDEVKKVLEAETDVEACIEFNRSSRGVTSALVGMGSPEHARSNAKRMREKTPVPDRVEALLGG